MSNRPNKPQLTITTTNVDPYVANVSKSDFVSYDNFTVAGVAPRYAEIVFPSGVAKGPFVLNSPSNESPRAIFSVAGSPRIFKMSNHTPFADVLSYSITSNVVTFNLDIAFPAQPGQFFLSGDFTGGNTFLNIPTPLTVLSNTGLVLTFALTHANVALTPVSTGGDIFQVTTGIPAIWGGGNDLNPNVPVLAYSDGTDLNIIDCIYVNRKLNGEFNDVVPAINALCDPTADPSFGAFQGISLSIIATNANNKDWSTASIGVLTLETGAQGIGAGQSIQEITTFEPVNTFDGLGTCGQLSALYLKNYCSGGGTVSNAFGIHIDHGCFATPASHIDNNYAIWVTAPRVVGTIGTNIGLRISDQTAGGSAQITTPYAIYSEGGISWFAGDMHFSGKLVIGGDDTTHPYILSGANSPETVVSAPIGSLFLNTNGGVFASLYTKAVGSGNTGWSPSSSIGPIVTKTTTYSITNSDDMINGNGTFTITLPNTGVPTGKTFTVKNIGVGVITISCAVNIDGATTLILTTQYQSATVRWDGTQYWVK